MQMMNARNTHIQGPQINQFNNISPNPIPRSSFNRSFSRRTTFNVDYLVPIFVDEILPGDELSIKMDALCRLTTPQKPLMDNLYLETFWFFCPYRLVWSNWEKFQGQQTNPADSVFYTLPVLNYAQAPLSTTGFTNESVYDYLGLPTLIPGLRTITSLYNRGVDLIWNNWFRDENLQNSIAVPTGDGPDDPSIYTLRKRNKRKDYITSCTPWPQKGTAVSVPIAGFAPVVTTGIVPQFSTITGTPTNSALRYLAADDRLALGSGPSSPGAGVAFGAVTGLQADMSAVSLVTINALRAAAIHQQMLELDARGGTRYVEAIYSRFGVVSPDFRLQRPELIGQGSTRVNVYAIPQTSESGSETPQGNLAAYGAATINGNHGCRYAATEHGMILGFVNVRADLTYQSAVPRMFTRSTRFDFYEPVQVGLGEQAVLRREVNALGNATTDFEAFGYQERHAEYRFKNSEITGKFRSNDPATLDIWHLSQELSGTATLNSDFITEAVPIDRVLAVADEPDFLMDMFFNYNHVRPLPIRSNPGIDRL